MTPDDLREDAFIACMESLSHLVELAAGHGFWSDWRTEAVLWRLARLPYLSILELEAPKFDMSLDVLPKIPFLKTLDLDSPYSTSGDTSSTLANLFQASMTSW